jgi:3-dehydroquinate synthase
MSLFSCLESEIFVGPIVESRLSKLLTEDFASSKKIILVDENTNEACLPALYLHLDGIEEAEIIELPAGEENKTMEMCFSVWEALSEMEVGRNDVIICLGGGMICDMGGFIASIYKRGMNCFYIPTSLLAMVDASIGGKTGVDLGGFKNQLGTFSQASHVFLDIDFLHTLPKTEKRNGLAEMLKHGLIADADHFNRLSSIKISNIEEKDLLTSLKIKTSIVERDPFEKGERKLLNFGHTVGHAIEGYFLLNEKPMAHGLAVAHGMLIESRISVKMNLLSKTDFIRIEKALLTLFPIQEFSDEEIDSFLQLMSQDKKRVEGESRFTLLEEIGKGLFDIQVKDEIIRSSFSNLD